MHQNKNVLIRHYGVTLLEVTSLQAQWQWSKGTYTFLTNQNINYLYVGPVSGTKPNKQWVRPVDFCGISCSKQLDLQQLGGTGRLNQNPVFSD